MRGFTIVELLAAILIIAAPAFVFRVMAPHVGLWGGVGAAAFAFCVCAKAIISFYKWAYRLAAQEEHRLTEKFVWIYRVTALPCASSVVVVAEGTNIAIGDYGWEAEPIQPDGLTYLHGLRSDWQVAWYAGFRSEQIERIVVKPRSQYYLPYSWVAAGSKAPPCPYSVARPAQTSLGYPTRIIDRWVQGKWIHERRK
jgi:prepilin-type N-terminal cleavage/methylation domain-containing protein